MTSKKIWHKQIGFQITEKIAQQLNQLLAQYDDEYAGLWAWDEVDENIDEMVEARYH